MGREVQCFNCNLLLIGLNMSVSDLSAQQARELLTASDTTFVIDFYGESCSPCKALAPVLEAVAEKTATVPFYKIAAEADDAEALFKEYGIRSVPTILFVKDGEVVKRNSGFIPGSKLTELVSSLIEG